MKIHEIKSEADFNNYKNGKNAAHLFTEVLSYLLAHVNKEHCCSNDKVTNVNKPTAKTKK